MGRLCAGGSDIACLYRRDIGESCLTLSVTRAMIESPESPSPRAHICPSHGTYHDIRKRKEKNKSSRVIAHGRWSNHAVSLVLLPAAAEEGQIY